MAVRLAVEPDESLDGIIARLKNYNSQEVLLVLPSDTHALQDLNSFTALRNTSAPKIFISPLPGVTRPSGPWRICLDLPSKNR